jgi:class 3 adenylate cyclase
MDNMAPATSQADPDWPELRQQRRAIVVVDVVESVRLMQANEADVIDRWRRFVNEVRTQVLPKHGGRLVKSLGDGLLLEFETVPAAVASTLEFQSLIGNYNAGRHASQHFALRIGVNVSDIVVDDDDIYGVGVNLTARLAGLASPGEIVVSPEVRDGLVDGLDADLEDMGECYLKHLEQPVRAFRLGRAAAPRLPVFEQDDEKDMRAVVAVVPFEFHGGLQGAEFDAIGELIADGVIALLSKSASVRLISRLSSSAFRGRGTELETVAQRLGAAYVLSGSYQCVGTRVALVAEIS